MKDLADRKKEAEPKLQQKPGEAEDQAEEEDMTAEAVDSPARVPNVMVEDEMEPEMETEESGDEADMETEVAAEAETEVKGVQPVQPPARMEEKRRGRVRTQTEVTSATEDTAEERSQPTGSAPSSQWSSSDKLGQPRRRRKKVKVKELLKTTPSSSEAEGVAEMRVRVKTRRRIPLRRRVWIYSPTERLSWRPAEYQ